MIYLMGMDASAIQDPIAKYYKPEVLFNQTVVLQNPDYRNQLHRMGFQDKQLPPMVGTRSEIQDIEMGLLARRPTIEEVLEKEFLKNRRKIYKNAVVQEFLSAGFMPLILFAGIIAINATPFLDTTSKGFINGIFFVNILFFFFQNIQPVTKLLGSMWYPDNDPLISYERAYAIKKPKSLFLMQKKIWKDTKNLNKSPSLISNF